MNRMEKGFTLLEMLVSIAVFSFVAIGIYYFFDSGRWMYLHSERRANLQENARLTVEAMEREMRLIGFGVPNGGSIGANLTWNPPVFSGDDNQIIFRGDIDSYNSLPTANVTGTTFSVEYPQFICPFNGIPIMVVERDRNWISRTCTGRTATTITVDSAITNTFALGDVELFATPLHVMYRLSPDTNGDAICDQATATLPDYTQCIVQRAERRDLTPQVDPTSGATWKTFATSISQFKLRYYRKTSSGLSELAVPLGTLASSVDVIRIDLTATDRADAAGEFQSANFRADVLIRKHRY